MLKVNLLVVFRTIFLKFTQKRDLAISTSEQAKHRLHKPSKPNIVFTSEASIASERGKRSLRKSSKPSMELRQPSAVFASKAQSEQIKHVSCERSELLRKPAKASKPSAVYAKKSYEFKSSVKFGTSQKSFKIRSGRTIF